MTTSISDVAARANVSVATVSRALRGLPNVAEATRLRVMQAAEDLDYVVNPNASRLAAGHNTTVGVVLPHTVGWYFQHVMTGIQALLYQRGYDMLIYTVPNPAARDRFLADLPFRKRVDGLLVIDVPMTDVEQRMLASLDIPLVAIGEGGDHYPLIKVDNRRGAEIATNYLLDLGHERIGLVSGPLDDVMRFSVANDRHAGWAKSLADRGVAAEPSWVSTGDFRMQHGVTGIIDLLRQSPGLTAVLLMSDEMAIGALRVLSQQNIRVPQDLSIIGFDGQEITEFMGITTVAQPMERLGTQAGEVLMALIRGESPQGFPRVLPVSLVVRETTSVPSHGLY